MRWRVGRQLEAAVAAKRRVQLALVVLIVLLAALLATGIYSAFALYHSAEDRYIHLLFPLRTNTQDLVLQMVNEEAGVRGYMLTGDRGSLDPYFTGRTLVTTDLQRITQLTRDHPELASQLEQLSQEITALHGYFDRQITFVADGRLGAEQARKNTLGGEALFIASLGWAHL